MAFPILVGSTDYTKLFYMRDPASTVGKGKTGLVAADFTASVTRVETDNDVVTTNVTSLLNNLSALTDVHNDWGIKEVSATTAPGLYRLDVADTVFASGAWTAVVFLSLTTGLASSAPIEFDLVLNVEADIASIKTTVEAIKPKTDLIPVSPAAVSDIPSAATVAAAVAALVKDGLTWDQIMGLLGASQGGKTNGSVPTGPGTFTIRSLADDRDLVVANYDANHNRTAVALNL